MVNVCPLCKKVLNEGEKCACLSREGTAQKGSASKTVKVITNAGSSTAFFIVSLFFTMSVFFNALSSDSSVLGVYGMYLGRFGSVGALADGAILTQTVINLITLLPSILICAGLWVLFFSFRGLGGSQAGTLIFLKGAVFAQFAVTLVAVAFMEGVIFTAFSFISLHPLEWGRQITFGRTDTTLWLFFLANAAAALVMVFYFIYCLKTADMVLKSLRAGKRWGDIPAFLIALNLILAAVNLVAAVFDIGKGNAAAAASAVFAAAFLAGMAASLNLVKRSM